MKKDSGCGMSQDKNNMISGTIADGKKNNFGNSVERTNSSGHCFTTDKVIKKTRQLMKQRTQKFPTKTITTFISIIVGYENMKVTIACQSQIQ